MPKFRKKPVVIEAFQVVNDHCPQWFVDEIGKSVGGTAGTNVWRIKTLEGDMIASPGDWIIRGVKGELYPCKPDIFAATYEPAE